MSVVDPLGAAYHITDGEQELFIIFNAASESIEVALPDGFWNVNVCDSRAGTEVLGQASGSVAVSPISATVLTR